VILAVIIVGLILIGGMITVEVKDLGFSKKHALRKARAKRLLQYPEEVRSVMGFVDTLRIKELEKELGIGPEHFGEDTDKVIAKIDRTLNPKPVVKRKEISKHAKPQPVLWRGTQAPPIGDGYAAVGDLYASSLALDDELVVYYRAELVVYYRAEHIGTWKPDSCYRSDHFENLLVRVQRQDGDWPLRLNGPSSVQDATTAFVNSVNSSIGTETTRAETAEALLDVVNEWTVTYEAESAKQWGRIWEHSEDKLPFIGKDYAERGDSFLCTDGTIYRAWESWETEKVYDKRLKDARERKKSGNSFDDPYITQIILGEN
jgi:hypothetical protein